MMRTQYTMEDVENLRMQLLAESYNSNNMTWTKEYRNEVRHTLRSAGYSIEELENKTTRAVKSILQDGYVVRCDCGTSYYSDPTTINCPECEQ